MEFASNRTKELGIDVESHYLSNLGHGIDNKAISYAKHFLTHHK
jgi:hypothetical protein